MNIEIRKFTEDNVEENRKRLFSIKSITNTKCFAVQMMFLNCGRLNSTRVFHKLLNFRIEARETVLKNLLRTCENNAKYYSEMFEMKSILTDETKDITGIN